MGQSSSSEDSFPPYNCHCCNVLEQMNESQGNKNVGLKGQKIPGKTMLELKTNCTRSKTFMRAEGQEQEEKKKGQGVFTDLKYWGMGTLVRYAAGRLIKEIKGVFFSGKGKLK